MTVNPASAYSANLYNPANAPVGGYGAGEDPFSTGQDASKIATGAAQSNLAAAPDLAKLSALINALNQAAQQQANAGRLGPQGQQIQSNLLGNLERQSAGLLDPQTEAMLQQNVAQMGAAGGFGVDSAHLAAAYRRALGQTIESTEAAAQKQYSDLLADNPSAPIFDIGSQLTTPSVYGTAASAQANRQQAAYDAAQERQIAREKLAQAAYQFEQQQQAQKQALATTAQSKAPLGYDSKGNLIPGGAYSTGYYDIFGHFHPGGSGSSGMTFT